MTDKIKTDILSSTTVETPTEKLLKFFTFSHLPEDLKVPSVNCTNLAKLIEDMIPDGPEKTAGMRKLLEAKDCFVRAVLAAREE